MNEHATINLHDGSEMVGGVIICVYCSYLLCFVHRVRTTNVGRSTYTNTSLYSRVGRYCV